MRFPCRGGIHSDIYNSSGCTVVFTILLVAHTLEANSQKSMKVEPIALLWYGDQTCLEGDKPNGHCLIYLPDSVWWGTLLAAKAVGESDPTEGMNSRLHAYEILHCIAATPNPETLCMPCIVYQGTGKGEAALMICAS